VIGSSAVPVAEVRAGIVSRPAVIGRTIFDYANDLAIQMPASCQRSGRCHECVVEIQTGLEALSGLTEAEAFLRPPFRLACQATIETVVQPIEFRPLRRRLRISVAHENSIEMTGVEAIDSPVCRTDGMVAYDGVPMDIDRGRALGLAVDVGTTTVVLELVDLETGAVLGVGAFENPQAFGGSDVMNRISYDGKAPGELRHALSRALNKEIRTLCLEIGIDRRVIYETVVVGNATMRDCFFGIDVAPIGQRPYKSIVELDALTGLRGTTSLSERAHRLGVWMNPRGFVVSPPLVASHVGADVAADLVALNLGSAIGLWMLVDIGTNTEVVVGDGTRILAASCPAGPAFEGGLVRYGMPGSEGAIEHAQLTVDGWRLETIGLGPAVGVCGSGLIDLLAELRLHGRMSPLGAFEDRAQEIVVEPVHGITLSREDASNLAQAKAANACGQAILLRHLGIAPGDLDHVLLAGGFANHIDVSNAIAIGFLAEVRPDRVRKVGNASILGARRLLLSRAHRTAIEELVQRVEHIELETTPDFFELFVEACQFKPMVSA
jgi:uncharacterized 2Fe-2S/4Fe-4S cluster protein (DUF4445 family)